LGIWTHNLKNIDYLANYHGSDYQGPAVKLGAGVQAHEVYEHAEKTGYTAVGGEGKVCSVVNSFPISQPIANEP
jgi:hypothetical protein